MKRIDPSVAAILLALSAALGHASAQDRAAVGGVVRDAHGIPQLGALVELLGPGSSVLAHVYTDDRGRYWLSVPQPGRYQVRTSATFLLPALRRNVWIGAGGRTLANITMTAVFDPAEWFPVERRRQTEPADDWRWALRSSAERPLLRFGVEAMEPAVGKSGGSESSSHAPSEIPDLAEGRAEQPSSAHPAAQRTQISTVAGTSGLLEDGLQQGWRSEWESVDGSILSLHASIGVREEGSASSPIKLSTSYQHRNLLTHSEYRVVAGFSSLPEVQGADSSGYQVASLATGERVLLGDLVTIDAGTLLSAERLVSYRISSAPFLRLVVHPAGNFAVMYRYASSPRLQSLDDIEADREMETPLSDAAGQPVGKAAVHQELAISRSTERDVTTLAVYQDVFTTGSLEGGGLAHLGIFENMPVLSNSGSGRFSVAVGGYTARGVGGSWTHSFSPDLKATLEGDVGTTLAMQGREVTEIGSLQSSRSTCERPSVTADVSGVLPKTATSLDVRYHWQPKGTLTIINPFGTSPDQAYASMVLRQRLWRGRSLHSVNATLEASNLLEEGYQPIVGPDGETLFLAQVPRTMQAGLTFTF